MPDFDFSEWVTTKEAARITGYRTASIRQSLIAGRLAGEKQGRDWFIKRDTLLNYMHEMQKLGKKKHTPKQYIKSDN